MDQTPPAQRRYLPVLLLLFVGSGLAALLYEVVWLQLLQLVIGLTTASTGFVLGAFMGGMCLGSLLLPRLISPKRHPLRVYAGLELGIGCIGILLLFLIPSVAHWYATFGGRGVAGFVARGALAAVCLVPPTVLMGATLPIMARWIEARGVAWMGVFYGGNIAGGVLGALVGGFYLLRVYDTAVATFIAAGINLLIAVAALIMAGRTAPNPEPSGTGPDLLPASALPIKGARVSVYVTVALSGMAALGAEVVWTRQLSLLLGGNVYTFSIILAVFLIGLGIGSLGGSALSRSRRAAFSGLAGCQVFLIVGSLWAAAMIARSLPFWPVNPVLSPSPWFNFQLDLARALWAVLPPALFWGASFPLAVGAMAAPGHDSGRVVGRLYAANTLGAIVGALGFSLLIIPSLGTAWGNRCIIAISAAAALVVLLPLVTDVTRFTASAATAAPRRSRRTVSLAIAAGVGVVAMAALSAWSVSPLPWGVAAYGRFVATYGARLAPGIVAEKSVPNDGGSPDIFCTYLGEGLNGTVAVTKWTSGVRSFHSAGKVQASNDTRDMRLQRMLGHLSALLQGHPESVLVVACGAGVTAGSFVPNPDVKRIVICDIEPLVPKVVAPMFEKENYAVVKDPRTQVVLDDGRHFVRTTSEKFDIITSDPIDPWVKGCAALNTVEYYQMCKDHLKPGGLMSLWVPLYENNPESIKSLIATFFQVFPDGTLWSNDSEEGGYDAVLLGRAGPATVDLDTIYDRLNRPEYLPVKKSLQDVGFHSATSLLSTYAGCAADLAPWLRQAQINTDRNLRLQYLAGMAFNSYCGPEILAQITRYYRFPESLFVGSHPRRQQLRLALASARHTNESSMSASAQSDNLEMDGAR